jgi:hypothetical protein
MQSSDVEGVEQCRQFMHLVVWHGVDGCDDSPVDLDLTLWADKAVRLLNLSEAFQ